MNRTIVAFTVIALGGCGGMQQKEPVRLEPFVANEALVKDETPDDGRKGDGLKLRHAQEEDSGSYPPKTPAHDVIFFYVRVALSPAERSPGLGTLSVAQGQRQIADLIQRASRQIRKPGASHGIGSRISLENLVQAGMFPVEQDPWRAAISDTSKDLDYTRFEVDLEKKRKWAVNIWGRSDHEGPAKNKNENNGGIGLRLFLDERSFLSADFLRNSVRGDTEILTWGREWKMFEIWGYQFSWVANLSHIRYVIPGKGVVHVPIIPIPALAIRNGDWAMNAAYLKDGNKDAVLIGFLSWFF